MASSYYVIVGLRRERCRAKDPAHCRHHVGINGKPLKHYKDAWTADRALDEIKRALDSREASVKRPVPMEGVESIDYGEFESTNEDEPSAAVDWTSLTVSSGPGQDFRMDEEVFEDGQGEDVEELLPTTRKKSRVEGMASTQWDDSGRITPGTMQSLNRLRYDSARREASSRAASNMIMLVMKGLKEDGCFVMELMWSYEGSTASWPEWWSTRGDDRPDSRTVTSTDATVMNGSGGRVYTDPSAASVAWTHDMLDDDGSYSCELLEWESGVYDAVRDGALAWEDLRGIGAVSCVLNAWTVTGRDPDGNAVTRTVNAWCGRKPRKDSYVEGDVDVNRGKAFRTLEDMMMGFEGMAVGMTQALVTLTVIGNPVDGDN